VVGNEPGATADSIALVSSAGDRLGSGGRVAAGDVDAPAWADDVWSFELRIPLLEAAHATVYTPLPTFPPAERDLALLLPDGVAAGQVEVLLRGRAGTLLEELWPFDLYEGDGIPAGTRSVAWRLRFRHAERTLTDAEVERVMEQVLRALDEELNVRRR
jgi:phenylalanyl-tRNA synthetase beta chain